MSLKYSLYIGQTEHNHAKKLIRLIEEHVDFLSKGGQPGQPRPMVINHTHVPELWGPAPPGGIEARITHESGCALVVNRNKFCDCDPDIVFLEKEN